jgi:hypothetical protein
MISTVLCLLSDMLSLKTDVINVGTHRNKISKQKKNFEKKSVFH